MSAPNQTPNDKYWSRPLFWWSAGGYQLTAALMLGFWWLEAVPLQVPMLYSAIGAAYHGWAYWMFSTGRNLTQRDPHMYLSQIVYGMSMQFGVLILAPQIGFLALMTLFLVFQFIALSGSARTFSICLLITAIVTSCILYVHGNLMLIPIATPAQRILSFVATLSLIARTGVLAIIMSRIRTQLHQSHARQRQTAEALSKALDQLQDTQRALVRNEKLAAMSRLVAGVAHELNTPIGNALLVSSTIRDATREIAHAVASKDLQRNKLSDFLSRNMDSADIVVRSMETAAHLISDFKQIAVTPDIQSHSRFNLRSTLSLELGELTAQFTRENVELQVDVPSDIEMTGYPLMLKSVVNHLIANALIHAFTGRKSGKIRLEAFVLPNQQICINVSDNGVGIPAADLDRIFDPFFTTRMGRGGTGLGLSIVHNLVTGPLGGRIDVQAIGGQGVSVKLVLPVEAPFPVDSDRTKPSAARR